MPFSKDNPPPSRKGRRNKLTGAHGDLLDAWDKVSGPKRAVELLKSALEQAIEGREIIKMDKDGNELWRSVIKDFDPIGKVLPYIACRMPETLRTPDLVGQRIVLILPAPRVGDANMIDASPAPLELELTHE